jgi:hypothetical protein
MLGDSHLRTPVNSGDTTAAQQKAGERWHDELFGSLNQYQSTTTRTDSSSNGARTERTSTNSDQTSTPSYPFGKIEMLDLFPSPYDIWAQKIEGIGKPKQPSLTTGNKTQETGNKTQETGNKTKETGNKIEAGRKPGDVLPVGNGSEEQAQESALKRLGKTVTEYEAGGSKLTPALRDQFEDIIVASDTPSPLIPGMSRRLTELRNEGVALLTPEKKQEIDETKGSLQTAMKALPLDKAKAFQDLAYVRTLARSDEEYTANIERQMETVAPGVLSKLEAYEKAVEPLTKIENEFSDVSNKLSTELGQNLITRSTYADLLLKDGDKQTAERYLREAYEKAPSLIENEEFVELMNRAGLKAEDMQKPKGRA